MTSLLAALEQRDQRHGMPVVQVEVLLEPGDDGGGLHPRRWPFSTAHHVGLVADQDLDGMRAQYK